MDHEARGSGELAEHACLSLSWDFDIDLLSQAHLPSKSYFWYFIFRFPIMVVEAET